MEHNFEHKARIKISRGEPESPKEVSSEVKRGLARPLSSPLQEAAEDRVEISSPDLVRRPNMNADLSKFSSRERSLE